MRQTEIKLLKFTCIFIFLLCFSSCASTPIKPVQEVIGSVQSSSQIVPSFIRQDVLHIVAPGETLWRISKMYDVKIEDIMKTNNLRSETKINMGQEILIPRASFIRPVVPLYESNKWRYIIIHHSATDEGDAFYFYKMHLRRGFWNGLGYHFVIDNGTFGKLNGQIEVSPRWIKQQDGAHCKASEMNSAGIGICVVGNFSKEEVSSKQMDSLIYLVRILRDYYHIDNKNIMGHGQVPAAATECPGLRFPWDEFWFALNAEK